MPEIGLEGQERIGSATVAIAGDDLACEMVARLLSAAGVDRLVLIRRSGAPSADVARALVASNPAVEVDSRVWPTTGREWLTAIAGATVIARSGFDDDPMVRAAVRTGAPVVVMRGREDRIDVVSFRRHGPCPHAPLDVLEKPGVPSEDGPGAVVAAHIAAAEILVLIAGATTGGARARHIGIPLAPDDGAGAAGVAAEVRAADIPWAPECFACGGSGSEMSFA